MPAPARAPRPPLSAPRPSGRRAGSRAHADRLHRRAAGAGGDAAAVAAGSRRAVFLYWNNDEFQKLLEYYINRNHKVTIETNGSLNIILQKNTKIKFYFL